jgi:hypothetical protein
LEDKTRRGAYAGSDVVIADKYLSGNVKQEVIKDI